MQIVIYTLQNGGIFTHFCTKPRKNMETKDKQERLRTLINLARLAGVCKTQKDFADFLGMSEHTISSALRGRENYLTDKQGDELQNTQETPGAFGKLIDEMQAQREMYDKHLSEALRIISKLTEKNG